MRALLFAAVIALAACGQTAQQAPADEAPQVEAAPNLDISNAWAAQTPGGVDVSAGYMVIENTGGAEDRLISASSPRAARVEIHEMSMDGAVMRMRPVETLAIPAGGRVELAGGGLHLMFIGVTQPFVEGEEIPVRLTFERSGPADAMLPVRGGAAHGGH